MKPQARRRPGGAIQRTGALAAAALCLAAAAPVCAADLSGCWEGSWQSCTTGHRGKLRAALVRTSDSTYCARFSGTFLGILPFRYTVELRAEDQGDVVELSGASYLGRLVGTFHYAGSATACALCVRYSSCKDCGTFRMCRACSGGP